MSERIDYMTEHAINDRIDRLTAICMTIGVGDVKYELNDDLHHARFCVTSTGVALIKAKKTDLLITAYVLKIDKAMAIFKKNGYPDVPKEIKEIIRRNEKKKIHQKIEKWG